MNPLEILRQTFRVVEIPPSIPLYAGQVGVYMLVDQDEIVYFGSSGGVEYRLYQHAVERLKQFSAAYCVPLPSAVHSHYEGAFIRALRPRYNRTAPRHMGYDNEILDGFGLEPHADEHANTVQWQAAASLRRGTPVVRHAVGSLELRMSARIAALRAHAGMTKSDLARAMGVTRQAVSNWEAGTCTASGDRFEQLCFVLGVSPSEFWVGESN